MPSYEDVWPGRLNMMLRRKLARFVERVIVGSVGLLIVVVVAMLVISVRRHSGLEQELQGSIEGLQETTSQLGETVEQLRSTTDDPEVLTDLEKIDDRLQEVDEQLGYLEENIDAPLLDEGVIGGVGAGDSGSSNLGAQRDFHSVFTTLAWLMGILSIVTAVALALVLSRRHSKRRRGLLNPLRIDRETP